jgi:signal transduction histidine kinase
MNDMQRSRHLEKIQGQVSHLTNLLETTLLFGKSQTKKLELYFEEADFREFCQRIVVDMQSIAGEKHIIRLQVDGDRFTYHLDKQLTYVLITNLITNSIKYSPKGGDIWIRVMCNKNLVQIAVQDAGIGIPPDDLARLFEDFYRAKNVGSIGGTGLGLTLVKHIVDSYHGTIMIESAVDVGTTFTIQLPLCSGVIGDKQ